MKALVAAFLAVMTLAGAASAAERPKCAGPDYLLLSDFQLKHVFSAVATRRRLKIAVVGTGSSALAGPDGPGSAYPARLQDALNQRLSGVPVKVVTLLRTRLTAEDLAKGMDKLLQDEAPDHVVWQTGTIAAHRRVDQDNCMNELVT